MAGFGFSISDLTTVASFAWKLYKSCKNAGPAFREASQDVQAVALHTVLRELEEEADNPKSLINRSGKSKRTELSRITSGCYNTLKELENLLTRHKSLGTGNKRLRDRINFSNADLQHIRQSLTMNTGVLNSFLLSLNSGSLGRIERKLEESIETKLDQIIRDVRSGNKDEELLSVADDDLTDDEKAEPWEALEDELSEEGIDRETVKKHKPWIEAQLHQRLIHDSSQDEADENKEDSSDEASISSSDSSRTIEPSDSRDREVSKSDLSKGKPPTYRPGDNAQSVSRTEDNPFSVHFNAIIPTIADPGVNEIILAHRRLSDAEERRPLTFPEMGVDGHHDDENYASEDACLSSSMHTVATMEGQDQSNGALCNREIRMSALEEPPFEGGPQDCLRETPDLDRPSLPMQMWTQVMQRWTQRMREEHPTLPEEDGGTRGVEDRPDVTNTPRILLNLAGSERQILELESQLQSVSVSLKNVASDYLRFLANLPGERDTQIQHPSPSPQYSYILEDIILRLESMRTTNFESATLRKAGLLVEAQRWARAISMNRVPEEKIVSYSHRMVHQSHQAERTASMVAVLVSLEEVQWGCTKRKRVEVTINHEGQSSQEDVEFLVPIPKGVSDGFVAEATAQDENGCNHTVEFRLRCVPHPLFARQGTDLYHNVVVSRRETKSGWQRKITTVSGASFTIESRGLGPAEKQVFPGKGLPDFDRPWMSGSLIVVAHVHLGNCSEQEYSLRLSKMFQGVSDEEINSDSSKSLIHL
ncbi:MAG: hypothetical protein Q9165_005548 [Trypethelium subeluteriae]